MSGLVSILVRVLILLLLWGQFHLLVHHSSRHRGDQEEAYALVSNAFALAAVDYDDGCGLQSRVKATWRNFTAKEEENYMTVLECMHRTNIDKPGSSRIVQSIPHDAQLQCHQEANPQAILTQDYRQIWFIGDSILRQTFATFVCELYPNLTRLEIEQTGGVGREAETIIVTPDSSRGLLTLKYSRFGRKWDANETAIYHPNGPFAQALSQQSSFFVAKKKHILVMNAGAHYGYEYGPELKQTATFVASQQLQASNSSSAAANMYFLEAADEQYPTRNGMFTWDCWTQRCTCAPLSAEQMTIPQATWMQSRTANLSDHHQQLETFYADLYGRNQSPLLQHPKPNGTCVVPHDNCIFANWRNDLIRPIFAAASPHIHLVPIWKQLTDHGRVHSKRRKQDCTHKSLTALLAITQQLVRTIVAHESRIM
eukprot:scaffold2032_cov122-Cylindrotheca_fusiformis.AAC.7